MNNQRSSTILISLALSGSMFACGDSSPENSAGETETGEIQTETGETGTDPSGDGDGEPSGDGDGEPAGDGDGEPAGDGDGEPSGDGDGEPSGDGDGEPSGDGDGDMGCIGELGCNCWPNETCVDPLLCVEGICAEPVCGDGVVAPNESCDDGNLVDSDGCNADCEPTEVVQLVAGGYHTCALFNSGEARCWGKNQYGQLGLGNTILIGDSEDPSTTSTIAMGGPAAALTAGRDHTCALLEDGEVRCWGYNGLGQLGYGNQDLIGDDEQPFVAGPVELGSAATSIEAGDYHTCVILDSGYPMCWGHGSNGRLGQPSTETIGDNEVPGSKPIISLEGTASMIVAGSGHTCAMRDDDRLLCWGNNVNGELGLGIGSSTYYLHQVIDDHVQLPSLPIDVDLGQNHSCAVLESHAVHCWGDYLKGAIGLPNVNEDYGDTEDPTLALELGGPAVTVTTGLNHSCALLETGEVVCWGQNNKGQLGYGATATVGDDEHPAVAGTVNIGGDAVALALGYEHSCALRADNEIVCWGEGSLGALGYANPNDIGDDELPNTAGTVEVY